MGRLTAAHVGTVKMFNLENTPNEATIVFSERDMSALAIILNHIEGRFEISANDIESSVLILGRMWNQMEREMRIRPIKGNA
jgi:hypothetical protein